MKLGIISDLHIKSHVVVVNEENIKEYINDIFKPNKNQDLDIIIIDGDISEDNGDIILFFETLSELFPNTKLLYTHGNHEMWNRKNKNNISTVELMAMMEYDKNAQKTYEEEIQAIRKNKSSYKKIQVLKRELNKIKNVHYLNGDIINIEGYRILGIPMWYDFSYGKKIFHLSENKMLNLWKNTMYDYDYIFWDEEQFNPIKYFKKQYEKLVKLFEKEKPDIVFSHVGPVVPENIPNKWKNPGTGFFYFEGKKLFDIHKPKIWIFGHTHDPYDFEYQNTRMICNPYGYKNEINNTLKVVKI